MGWTYTHKDKKTSIRDFFQQQLRESEGNPVVRTILDCAVIDFTEAYMAYEIANRETGEREVVALVFAIRFTHGECNFGYKDMDETMGPYFHRCPKRILDALTPTDNENALEWRAKCRETLAAAKARPSIRKGDILVFPRKIKFTDGTKESRFTAVDPKKNLYRGDRGFAYRLNRNALRNGSYEIHRGEEVLRSGNKPEVECRACHVSNERDERVCAECGTSL